MLGRGRLRFIERVGAVAGPANMQIAQEPASVPDDIKEMRSV